VLGENSEVVFESFKLGCFADIQARGLSEHTHRQLKIMSMLKFTQYP